MAWSEPNAPACGARNASVFHERGREGDKERDGLGDNHRYLTVQVVGREGWCAASGVGIRLSGTSTARLFDPPK